MMGINIEYFPFFKGYYGLGQAIIDISSLEQWLENFEDYKDMKEAVERLNDKAARYYTTEQAESALGL